MPRIVLSGYYGFDNAGDEAILEATIAGLRRQAEDLEIVALSADPGRTASLYGVLAVDRWNWREVWRETARADLFVSGGGSLIQDATSRLSPYYYLGLIRLAGLVRTPAAVYAQGLGPIHSRLAASWTARLFRRAVLVSVRDEGSRAWLEERGVSGVQVVPDPAAALVPAPEERLEEIETELGLSSGEPRLGFALRPWPGAEALADVAAQVARRAAEGLGARVLLFACQKPGDGTLAEGIAERVGPSAVVVPSPPLPSELLGLVARCRALVGMRLHSLIFAAARGVPFVAVDYDPKIPAFCRSFGVSALPVTVTPDKLWDTICCIWSGAESQREALEIRAATLRAESERNFRALADISRKVCDRK